MVSEICMNSLTGGEEDLLNVKVTKKVYGSVMIANAVVDILQDLIFQKKDP